MSDSTVTITGLTLKRETERAMLLVHDESSDEVWLPKSQVSETDLGRIGSRGFVKMPEWLASKQGWA